eukprot:187616-Chlamydomonas_euryale.AAC.2
MHEALLQAGDSVDAAAGLAEASGVGADSARRSGGVAGGGGVGVITGGGGSGGSGSGDGSVVGRRLGREELSRLMLPRLGFSLTVGPSTVKHPAAGMAAARAGFMATMKVWHVRAPGQP